MRHHSHRANLISSASTASRSLTTRHGAFDLVAGLLAVLLATPLIVRAALPAPPPGDHALTFKSTADGSEQPYRLYVPMAAKRLAGNAGDANAADATASVAASLPLLVVLHGKGANQNAWFDHTPVKEAAETRGYLVAAPYGRGDWFYRGPAEQDVLDILREVSDRFPVDPDRVYLTGHSMGGWGTWWLGLRHPDLFAAICPMAGLAPTEYLPNARNLSPFVIHCADDIVVRVASSREPVGRLIELGISVNYREESGFGHSSKMIGANFHRLFDWFDQIRKDNHPRRITFATRTPAAGNAHWIRVLATDSFPRLATIDASLDTTGTLRVAETNIRSFGIDVAALPSVMRRPILVKIVDDFEAELTATDGWALFTRKGNEPGWIVETGDASLLPTYRSPVVAKPAPQLEETDHQEFIARALGERLRRETGADIAFVCEDMFRLPSGPVTADAILDAFIWGDERAVRIRTSVHHLREYINSLTPLQKFLWGKCHLLGDLSRPHDTVAVVVPARLARELELPMEALPDAIPEYLYRSVRPGEVFP